MTDALRYDIDDPSCVECCEEGDYVLFKDYEKLRVENAAQRARMAEDRAVYLKERKFLHELGAGTFASPFKVNPLDFARSHIAYIEATARELRGDATIYSGEEYKNTEAPPTPAEYPVIGYGVDAPSGITVTWYATKVHPLTERHKEALRYAKAVGMLPYQLLRGEMVP